MLSTSKGQKEWKMFKSVSGSSLGTIGNVTTTTQSHGSRGSAILTQIDGRKDNRPRNSVLWNGTQGKILSWILFLPWTTWWQAVVIIGIMYKYIIHLLMAYYFNTRLWIIFITVLLGEINFFIDLVINMLHAFWPAVRYHIRVYRRNYVCLVYDATTVLLSPLVLLSYFIPQLEEMDVLIKVITWLIIGRIYRIVIFFREVNGMMAKSRRWLFMFENLLTCALILHMSTCLWYDSKKPPKFAKEWYSLQYPVHVSVEKLKSDTYLQCFYIMACRCFNTIFGDCVPVSATEKTLCIAVMMAGFIFVKNVFIGYLAWEIVLERSRWASFVDVYHHMVLYLKSCGAPQWLIEQAKNYMQELWNMKRGVLTSKDLKDLPYSLQTELIFDINVAYLHNSLLFRDTGEAYMRQLSLLMKHEIYLEGQVIWSQGVVKNGMFCVKRGVIELLSDEDDESPMIAFKDGTVLGELCLFYSIPSKVTVKAATYVELQTLKRTDFLRAMVEHPQILKYVRQTIGARLKNTMRRQKAIEEYDKGDSRLIRTRYRPMKILKDRLAGVEDEDPTFVDDSHLYYRDENNERQEKFTEDYLELYELTQNVTTVDTPKICLNSNFPWILEPDTAFTHMFDVLHFCTVLYVCFISPIHAILTYESDTEMVMDCIVTAVLILTIYLQLTTSIVHRGERKETIKEITELKMSSFGFYLDVISVFPLYIFADSLDPVGVTMAPELAKLCTVVQVWHIWDYIKRWEMKFDSNVKFLCLCKYSILLLIFCYWCGIFLYIYACPKRLCLKDTWMARLIFVETKAFVTNDARHERPLLSALTFGIAVFTGSGTAEYVPGVADLMVVLFLIICGSYFYTAYMAEICANYLLETKRKLKFKESMRELFYFLSVNHVSNKIKARVKKYFIVQWYYNQAVSTREIFKDMSDNVQQEILSIEMVESLLQCPIFQECSQDFLQTVASNVTTVVLPDSEIVQHGADIGRDMYIIYKGHCNLLNFKGKVEKTLGPGCHFGAIEMLYGLPKVYTVVTSTNCILRHIEYTALVQSWSTFPDSSHAIFLTLHDQELQEMASLYDEAKPLIGRLDNKTNRIAQEIKESFVILRDHEANRQYYVKTFDKLGYLRFLRYVFLPICVTPYGIFLKIWCFLRVIVAFYYIIVIPYYIAVRLHLHQQMFYWTDIFLYIDIIVMAYLAYYNEKSLLITHPLLAATNYLKTTFIWDLISVFPFELLVQLISDHKYQELCRINKLLLVTRISGAFSYYEGDIVQVNPVVVMLKSIPIVLTFVNFMTAIIFMSSCIPVASTNTEQLLVSCMTKSYTGFMRADNVVAIWEYLRTLVWVFEIFLGCGCTPTTMGGSSKEWLMSFLRVVGLLYFGFVFGYVSSTCSVTSRALLEHNENTKDLENFLYQQNVDPMLTDKTLKYFEYVWKRTNGNNPQQICRGLNSALMEDTLVFMYERALREVPLFGKAERSFIRVITQHLHEMYFLKGEMVVQCRDMLNYIYIIYRGKVDVLNKYNEMVSCMGPGGMFGNFTGQPISCSEVSIYASRSLDLLVIPSQTFFNLVKYYPKLQEPLARAFELSKDYILPITMEAIDTSSDDESSEFKSEGSEFDSRSESSKLDIPQISSRSSHSNVSTSKSSASVATFQSFAHILNITRPGSWLYQVFGYLTSIMATASYALVLYEIVTLNDCVAFFWIHSTLDIFFYIKWYLSMHQSYMNKRGEFVTISSKCRSKYKYSRWLWADILVNFPLELLGFCFAQPLLAMHYLRANKLFRLIYIVQFYRNTAAELTNNYTSLQTATTVLVVILLLHTGSCFWLVTMVAIEPQCLLRTVKAFLIDDILSGDTLGMSEEQIRMASSQESWDYITSALVVVSELTGTGGDEYQLNSMLPQPIIAITLVCGKMLATMVVAAAIQIAYSTKYALTRYEKKTHKLIDMLRNQGLSDYQTKKYWKYVKQLWVNERGRQLPALLAQTPYVRRCDLMSAMFGHHLRNCYLFADTGEAFIRQLTAVLEYTVFFPGNYIVTAGNTEARLYWVTSGTVAVLSVRSDLTETTHERLGPGDVFSMLQGLNRGIAHAFSYRAETNVSILTLSLDSWINILQFFPEANSIIAERSEFLFTQID